MGLSYPPIGTGLIESFQFSCPKNILVCSFYVCLSDEPGERGGVDEEVVVFAIFFRGGTRMFDSVARVEGKISISS